MSNEETTLLEINNDPTTARSIIQQLVTALRGPDGKAQSREISLAVTKLQEANFWLGESLFGAGAFYEPNNKPRRE